MFQNFYNFISCYITTTNYVLSEFYVRTKTLSTNHDDATIMFKVGKFKARRKFSELTDDSSIDGVYWKEHRTTANLRIKNK